MKIVNRTYYNMTYVLRRTTVKFERKGKVDKNPYQERKERENNNVDAF